MSCQVNSIRVEIKIFKEAHLPTFFFRFCLLLILPTTSVHATSIGQWCDLLIFIHLLTKPSNKQHVFSLQNNDCYVKQ
jgi:hypothetical protein